MTWPGGFRQAWEGVALGLAAFMVGCGGGGGDGGTGPNPPPGGQPAPLSVQVTLDEQRTASATLSPSGGSVSATSADGSNFTLDVPAGALGETQTISLTPVLAIDGLPFSGGLIAAVQLRPDGLGLLGAATLTLHAAAPMDPAKAVGFGYQGPGEDFHLEPVSGTGTMVFTLTHFSGYGIGSGTPADASRVKPTSAENQAKHQIVELQRANPSGNWTAAELNQLREIFRQWYTSSVQPGTTAAETDESKLIDASNDWMAWIVWMQTLFGDPGFHNELFRERDASGTSLANGYKNAINNGFTKCSANHDLSQVHKMVIWSTMAQWYTLGYGFDRELAQNNVRKCANFKLNFFSNMVAAGTGGLYGSTLEGKEIPVVSVNGLVRGELDYLGLTWPLSFTKILNPPQPSNDNCDPWVSSPQESTLSADLAIQIDTSSAAEKPQVKLAMDPGSPHENWSTLCPHNITLRLAGVWAAAWMGFHSDELRSGVGKFVITDWEILGGESYARKTYSRTKSLTGGDVTEATILELKHAPQQ